MVRLRPLGQVDTGALAKLEYQLGRALPPIYRAWLARTNGVVPQSMATLHGTMLFYPERPFLGVRPDTPPHDLVHNDNVCRHWLGEDFVVVARPDGGLVAVKAAGDDIDSIWSLPTESRTPQRIAEDIHGVIGLLEPVDGQDVDPPPFAAPWQMAFQTVDQIQADWPEPGMWGLGLIEPRHLVDSQDRVDQIVIRLRGCHQYVESGQFYHDRPAAQGARLCYLLAYYDGEPGQLLLNSLMGVGVYLRDIEGNDIRYNKATRPQTHLALAAAKPHGDFLFAATFDGTDEHGRPQVSLARGWVEDLSERDRLAGYLDKGEGVMVAAGFDFDRFDALGRGRVPIEIRTDGQWLWSAGASYYLRRYGVAPDPLLHNRIVAQGYTCPEVAKERMAAAIKALS